MSEITSKDVTNAIKFFVEFGGWLKVDDEFTICNKAEEPVVMEINGKQFTIKILADNLKGDNFRVLNLFKEIINEPTEVSFFHNAKRSLPGTLIKLMLLKSIEKIIKEKDENKCMKEIAFLDKYVNKIDDKTYDELDKIPCSKYGIIQYDKKNRTANFVVSLFKNIDKYELRKKTKDMLYGMYEHIFKTSDFEELYKYRATSHNLPKLQATLGCLAKVCDRLKDYTKHIIDVHLDMDTYMKHFDMLEEYSKLSGWFGQISSTINESSTNTTQQSSDVEDVPPWKSNADKKVKVSVGPTFVGPRPMPVYTPGLIAAINMPAQQPSIPMNNTYQQQQPYYNQQQQFPMYQNNIGIPFGY